MTDIRRALISAFENPYDAPDDWDGEPAMLPEHWTQHAARAVLADLRDRKGIKHELEAVDAEIRVEIVQALTAIIRAAWEERPVGR